MKKILQIFLLMMLSQTAISQTNIKFEKSWFGDYITYKDLNNQENKIGITTYLTSGQRPTVIHLHGCGGVRPYAMTWVNRFKEWGYNVVVVDSFRHRWLGNACYNVEYLSKRPIERIHDMYAAAEWIMQQPWNTGKPAAVGYSHGAQVLHIASTSNFVKKSKSLISSAIAFYPYCHYDVTTDWEQEWPMQIHVGKLDNWTPAWLCDGHARFQSDKFDYQSYDNAHHGWDIGINETMTTVGVGGYVRPRTIAYNAKADQESADNTKRWLQKFFQ